MEFIKCHNDADVLVASMMRGKANALNRAMMQELIAMLEQAATDDAIRAIVLTSESSRFFSSGFDVAEVFQYDRQEMHSFFGEFIDLYESIQRLPKGVVAAVTGHAFAGGAILALACDMRVMTEASCGYAFNEVKLGISLPPGVARMLIGTVGAANARQLLLSGEPVTPCEALQIGLVNELAPPDAVLDRALERARALAATPPTAFAAIKQKINSLTGLDAPSDHEVIDEFLDQWVSAESKAARHALVESMRR